MIAILESNENLSETIRMRKLLNVYAFQPILAQMRKRKRARKKEIEREIAREKRGKERGGEGHNKN